ncbi:MAG: hypothetical protein ABL856_12420 [Gallionella sp.]
MEPRFLPEGFFKYTLLGTVQIVDQGVTAITALPAEELQSLHINLQTAQRQIKQAVDLVNAALDQRYGAQAAAARRASGKDFGVCHLTDGPLRITVEQPKRVAWDQQKLAALAARIAAAGENVGDFVDVEYSISESRYTNWPSTLKEQFADARTVKPGKPSYRIALVSEEQQ